MHEASLIFKSNLELATSVSYSIGKRVMRGQNIFVAFFQTLIINFNI